MDLKIKGLWTGAGLALALAMTAQATPAAAQANEVIPLYKGAVPGVDNWPRKEAAFELNDPIFNPPKPDTVVVNVTVPTLTVFRPAPGKANGTAMVVAPGGGFRVLSYRQEGVDIAKWLTAKGVTVFVLKYRLNQMPVESGDDIVKGMAAMARMAASAPAGAGPPQPPRITIGPVENGAISDGQEAVKLVRARAAEFGVDPNRIGIIGFSAGGMVSGGAAVRAAPADRPNFVGIIYSFVPDPIPAGAPPAFMAAAADDPLSGAMPELFTRWRAAGAPAEIHIYAKGHHGFGAYRQGLPVDGWMDAFYAWLGQQGFAPAG